MKLGLALAVGAILLALAIFTPFAHGALMPAYWIGLAVTALSFVRLLWIAWHGSLASAFAGATSGAILTWVAYELVRQTPGVPSIGFLDEMTAPVLSSAVGVLVVVLGVVRARGRQDAARSRESSIPTRACRIPDRAR